MANARPSPAITVPASQTPPTPTTHHPPTSPFTLSPPHPPHYFIFTHSLYIFAQEPLYIVKYYIKENSWLARLAAKKLKQDKMAMVLGKTILLHDTTTREFINNRKWIRHELAHVHQFKQHGYLPFLIKYLVESIRNGYYDNKYEKEARAAEEDERFDKFIPPFRV